MKLVFKEKISDGAFADIWRASDELDRELVIKIVRPASVGISNALSHAKALARARHPNVVVVHSIEQVNAPEGGELVDCVVMEFLEGETLEARLCRSILLVSEVKRIGQGLLDALSHIHSQGMIHGDLHEQNVMVVNGDAKVIDLLHRHSLAVLSSNRREQGVQHELLMLQRMLQLLLTKSEVARERVIEFGEKTLGNLTLNRLNEAFLNAISDGEPEILLLTYPKTPRNLLNIIDPGMHQENVRSLLGTPSYIDLHRWIFQFRDTQVEVIFNEAEPTVSAVILALVHGNIYRGTNPSAHVDLPLGEMSFFDILEHYPEEIEYFDSLRTKEIYIRGRWGPPGAWTYYAFGALHVFSGIGMLEDVDFEWDKTTNQLKTDLKKLRPNWMAVTSFSTDVPGFNWYIKRHQT